MSIELNDGTIIPSQFDAKKELMDPTMVLKQNHGLRTGQVIKIHYPDEQTSISKKYHEYDVLVAHGDVRLGTNISIYRNCKVSNVFASNTDSEVYTLKPGAPAKDNNGTYEGGAVVTLLCIDGRPDAGQALILGGLNSPQFAFKKYTKNDGNFYDFNFNGINININKDGEYTVEFNSVLDKDGKPTNKDAQGTKIVMDKEGRIKISDNKDQSWELDRVAEKSVWTNKAESITIDKKNKSISMVSSGAVSSESKEDTIVKSDARATLDSKGDMNLKTAANQTVSVSGNANMKAASWNVNIQGAINIKSGSVVNIEGGTLANLKALQVALGAGTMPVGVANISKVLTMFGPIPLIGDVITGSSTVKAGT